MDQTYSELLNSATKLSERELEFNVPENWMQGRTTYGGLSASICLRAAEMCYGGLPPLRAANVVFTGPVGGPVVAHTKELRRGKSVAYIQADLIGEQGHAAQVVFCFGRTRDSKIDSFYADTPSVPSLEDSTAFFLSESRPVFSHNFEVMLAKGGHPVSGSKEHEHYLWIKHKDQNATDLAALIGIADMPPPAVLPMFTEPKPISSMTWSLNFTQENPQTENGWWLMRTAAEHAKNGYSSQDMQVWNSNLELVITGRQNVAIFY